MRIKGAMTVLNKRAEFYGVSFDELMEWFDGDGPMQIKNEILSVIQAYEVYKKEQGYVWSGVNFETWVKKENI